MQNKKAFSLVEIIISLSIIVLLAVIWMSINQNYKNKVDNTKITSDIETVNNALESYSQENNLLPMPWGNTNFFKIDTSYAHSYTGATTFWVYWSITEDTIAKKYLDVLPLDPRTNSYYSYWKTAENVDKLVANQFELASVQNIDWEFQAFVTWNYTAEAWPYNLIREYNGSNFVYDRSKTNFPYNPEELILIATVNWEVKREWDPIHAEDWDLEIYFSDGSVSVLEHGWKLTLNKLNFPNKNNLNTIIKLWLSVWTIWTKATHLNDESEFEIYTTDSSAAVRGTIFWVKKDSMTAPTEVLVIEWEVEVYKNDEQETNIVNLIKDESVRVLDWEIDGTTTLEKSDYEDIEDNFIVQEDIRGAETVAMINKEIIERENESGEIEINLIDPIVPIDEQEAEIVEPTLTCTTSTDNNNWFITTITCDSDNNEVITYSCQDNEKQINSTETDCEDIPEQLCIWNISEWEYTIPEEIYDTNAYFKNQCINDNWNLVLWDDIFVDCKINYSLDENTWNSCVSTLIDYTDEDNNLWKKNWNWYSYDLWKLLQCFDTTNFVVDGNECVAQSCNIWLLTWWFMDDWKCLVELSNITPWISKTLDLTWPFEIELEVTEIPQTKQYLLYGWSNFKLFFWNWTVGQKWEICFDADNTDEDPFCKNPLSGNKIIISRDSSGNILLNDYDTWKNVSIINNQLYIWSVNDTSFLKMYHTNKIKFAILK